MQEHNKASELFEEMYKKHKTITKTFHGREKM